jgi:hypothetical protein
MLLQRAIWGKARTGPHEAARASGSQEITMDIFRGAERLMGMNDETWERHANPLSVSCLPLIVAAIWSRVWLGWWALAPLALAIGWTFINPRLFPAPIDKATGAAKAVMGERFFLFLFLGGGARHLPSLNGTSRWLIG